MSVAKFREPRYARTATVTFFPRSRYLLDNEMTKAVRRRVSASDAENDRACANEINNDPEFSGGRGDREKGGKVILCSSRDHVMLSKILWITALSYTCEQNTCLNA